MCDLYRTVHWETVYHREAEPRYTGHLKDVHKETRSHCCSLMMALCSVTAYTAGSNEQRITRWWESQHWC